MAKAGDAATVVVIAPNGISVYNVLLDSEPAAKWPRSIAGRYLIPKAPGISGGRVPASVLLR
ncbi:hypothetical protein J2Y41_004655 [Arthrobacter sp. 1088]|uniref:hypothetical protein n=1 Tax=Arthrobacter sp. 1088 TaxID=2817768 RepID=UPI00286261F3|nr:hypothetical protein [Arthrobacter sp. 1088]MDR6689051.1 hypothetical protein [Arthrobacter sp. 1088]